MNSPAPRETLDRLLARVRRRLFLKSAWTALLRGGLVLLPLCAVAVAIDRRWNGGQATPWLVTGAGVGLLIAAVLRGLRGLGQRVGAALVLDSGASLKDRVSSACEFLDQERLDEAEETQVRDALRRAGELDVTRVLRFEFPRFAAGVPVGMLLLALAFLVQPLSQRANAYAARDAVREAQLQMLEELKQDLTAKQDLPKELEETVKKLEEIKKQFERGEIGERDVMLQLGRLDEALRSKMAELGVENLESEMNAIVPHLAANAATAEAAKAIQEQKLDKAAEEMKQLADKVADKKLTKDEKKKLAAQLGAAGSKLGKKKSNDSFAGDLAKASESLESESEEGFKSACQSMGQKLGLLSKCKGLKSACNKVGLCKSCLSQCNSRSISSAPKTLNKNKGGKGAGTAASGDPLGEANRLGDAMKKMVQIQGQAGQGPVETQTEVTDGQMSESQLTAKEIHAKYAQVAEEVIEREDVPLSHRYHVKRYFQSIRPQE